MTEEDRNIIDYYHYWKTEAIKADLDTKRHDFSVLISNQLRDFNIGTVVRNSNAFLAARVYTYGRKKFDKRGTVGTHHYENLVNIKDLAELPNVPVIAMDNVEGAQPIEDFVWPKGNFIMAFGQEQVGVPQEILDIADAVVYIKQYGSVRSLNVGTAAGIAMFDYCSKMEKDNGVRV